MDEYIPPEGWRLVPEHTGVPHQVSVRLNDEQIELLDALRRTFSPAMSRGHAVRWLLDQKYVADLARTRAAVADA